MLTFSFSVMYILITLTFTLLLSLSLSSSLQFSPPLSLPGDTSANRKTADQQRTQVQLAAVIARQVLHLLGHAGVTIPFPPTFSGFRIFG